MGALSIDFETLRVVSIPASHLRPGDVEVLPRAMWRGDEPRPLFRVVDHACADMRTAGATRVRYTDGTGAQIHGAVVVVARD